MTSNRRRMPPCNSHFNSHPHEEDDGIHHGIVLCDDNFNSHPHEEDDGGLVMDSNTSTIFQLTSSRRG